MDFIVRFYRFMFQEIAFNTNLNGAYSNVLLQAIKSMGETGHQQILAPLTAAISSLATSRSQQRRELHVPNRMCKGVA